MPPKQNAFGQQSLTLLPRAVRAGGKGDAAIGAQYPEPGHGQFLWHFAQGFADQSCPTRQTGQVRDLAIGCDTAGRYVLDRFPDAPIGGILSHVSRNCS